VEGLLQSRYNYNLIITLSSLNVFVFDHFFFLLLKQKLNPNKDDHEQQLLKIHFLKRERDRRLFYSIYFF
jgi:hypothetical protein